MAIIQEREGYRFGSASGLRPEQMDRLIPHFSQAPDNAAGPLGGRNQPHATEIDDWGPVVIKHYFRGGMIRHLNRRTYLRAGPTRSEAEFDLLMRLREIGVNAPEPMAFAYRGRLLYRAWLVMKKIPETVTLADLSRSAPEEAEAVMPAVVDQVRLLIKGGVLHVDLHPGNLLIDADRRVFVIDLDKAETGKKNRSALRRRYLRRWERAVEKYGLPAFLHERLRAGLTAGAEE